MNFSEARGFVNVNKLLTSSIFKKHEVCSPIRSVGLATSIFESYISSSGHRGGCLRFDIVWLLRWPPPSAHDHSLLPSINYFIIDWLVTFRLVGNWNLLGQLDIFISRLWMLMLFRSWFVCILFIGQVLTMKCPREWLSIQPISLWWVFKIMVITFVIPPGFFSFSSSSQSISCNHNTQ